MPSYLTTTGAQYIAETMFGRTQKAVGTYYLALLHAMPDPGSQGDDIDEPDDDQGYGRASITNASGNFVMSGYYEIFNAVPFVFPTVPPEADWGRLTCYGLLDTQSVGTGRLLMFGTLNPALRPKPLSVVRVRVGQLAITVSSMTPSYQPL